MRRRQTDLEKKWPFLEQLIPYLFSSLGASAYSEHGCGLDLSEQTPQRERETTEAMAILRGWYDR